MNGVQDSLGFWIARRGFWIPGNGFQFLSVEVGFWILIVSGIPDSLSFILVSTNNFSWIPESRFADSLTWGELISTEWASLHAWPNMHSTFHMRKVYFRNYKVKFVSRLIRKITLPILVTESMVNALACLTVILSV